MPECQQYKYLPVLLSLSAVFLHTSNRSLSLPFLLLVIGSCRPAAPVPSVFLNVSDPCFPPPLFFIPPSLHASSFPSLSCPCLFLSLYRTPNVSSNGNPGYESLPLTDRQSPPPSVSSSVLVTSSHSVPFYHCSFWTPSL